MTVTGMLTPGKLLRLTWRWRQGVVCKFHLAVGFLVSRMGGSISETRQRDDGGVINHPLFFFMFRLLLVQFHPLFGRYRGGIKNCVDAPPEKFEELSSFWCDTCNVGVLRQFICQCIEVLMLCE